jgi:hypothetical protein
LFNGGKIRALEQALEEAKSLNSKYEDAIVSAATALSSGEANAIEILTAVAGGLLPSESLPGAAFGIEVWDRNQIGVGGPVSEFAQSLSFALQEFLKSPNVSAISTRKESRSGPNYTTLYSDVHSIVFTTKCLCELEVCCGAVHTLLHQAFETHSPKVTTTSFSKEKRTATLEVVIG